jgi:hypothetical protein
MCCPRQAVGSTCATSVRSSTKLLADVFARGERGREFEFADRGLAGPRTARDGQLAAGLAPAERGAIADDYLELILGPVSD